MHLKQLTLPSLLSVTGSWASRESSKLLETVINKKKLTKSLVLQRRQVYSTLKRCRNGNFHVVSTWNTRGVFVGNLMIHRILFKYPHKQHFYKHHQAEIGKKSRSHRYNINRASSKYGHKYSKYKKCLSMMMFICIKQHLSNIWSSIHEKVKLKKERWLWKSVYYFSTCILNNQPSTILCI